MQEAGSQALQRAEDVEDKGSLKGSDPPPLSSDSCLARMRG